MTLQAIDSFFYSMASCSVMFNHVYFALQLLEYSIRCSTHHGQKAISVVFDNHRAPRLVPVVLELRYRLALDSPGEMHYNHRAPRLVPVVLELRYRLALETH